MTEPMVVLPPTWEKRIQNLALPPDQEAKLREKVLASFDDGAVQRRIERYFEVKGGPGESGADRWDLRDCDEGHFEPDLHAGMSWCGRCGRFLNPEGYANVSTDRIHEGHTLGEIRKDGLSINGQVYRPYRGKAYIEVRIVQPVDVPVPLEREPGMRNPRGMRKEYVELERFRVYFEEP